MSEVLLYTAFINLAALVIMVAMVIFNRTISKRQKNGFVAVFLTIIVIIIAELITVVVNKTGIEYRWLNVLANYIGFILTPVLPVLCGGVISNFKRTMPFFIILAIYGVILAFTTRFNIVFNVDYNNIYHRCPFYWIFIMAYLIGIFYLFVETIKLGYFFQNNNKIIIGLMLTFLIAGTSVQVVIPSEYLSWTCVTLVTIIYYTYCNDLWLKVDRLTGLLNHGCYLREIAAPRKNMALILFDVDNFKYVNDTYGHLFGDKSLKCIAETIKSIFGKSGICYRIGGDEYAVILYKNFDKIENLKYKFMLAIKEQRVGFPELPGVSVGFAVYEKGKSSVNDIVNEADKVMYIEKSKDLLGKQNLFNNSTG